MKKSVEKFCTFQKLQYLCTRQTTTTTTNGLVAQLNRASDYGSEGYRFESCRDHKKESKLKHLLSFFHIRRSAKLRKIKCLFVR